MENYINKILSSDSIDEINEILENSAWDDDLTNAEYAEIQSVADLKVRMWQPTWNISEEMADSTAEIFNKYFR